jgi:hypothetical protein
MSFEVAVVLHLGQHDQVARVDVGAAPGIGHEIDALAGIAREDNLFALTRIDKACHLDSRLLHAGRGLFADLIDAAMHIGIVHLIVLGHRLDYRARLLRAGRTVEIHQRFAVYLARQNRKVLANFGGAACGRRYVLGR